MTTYKVTLRDGSTKIVTAEPNPVRRGLPLRYRRVRTAIKHLGAAERSLQGLYFVGNVRTFVREAKFELMSELIKLKLTRETIKHRAGRA